MLIIVFLFLYMGEINDTYKDKNMYKMKIDNIEIIKRGPEYQKLIDKLINNKKELFTKEEIKIMENKFQFYNNEYGIDNISDEMLNTFKDYDNKKIDNTPEENIYISETINENPAYNAVLNNIGKKYRF